MSINDLPTETLERILSFVPPRDRIRSSILCRRWAELFVAPALMRDVWLDLRTLGSAAEALVSNSNRQYHNIRLFGACLFEFNSAIWTKLGMSLRKLELNVCRWSPEVFYSILQACPNLESLTIHDRFYDVYEDPDDQAFGGYSVQSPEIFELPPGMDLRTIQESTRNLRHLDLMVAMDGDMLEQILVAMPNVLSIALSRFDWNSDFLDRLPSLLGTNRGITKLALDPDIASEDNWTRLLRISSNTLRVFIATPYVQLNRQGYAALGNCTILRQLNITITSAVDDNLLHHILLNNSQLEILNLSSSEDSVFLSPEALMPILEFKKLRELSLSLDVTTRSDPRVSNKFLRNLGRLSSLEKLILDKHIGDVDDTSFQNWANLRNLRYLQVGSLRWNANCLRTFLLNLRNLRELWIVGSESRDEVVPNLPQLSESERKIVESADCSISDCRGGRIESSYLESLTMTGVPLTDVGLTHIAAYHDRLKYLSLWQCNNITDEGLVNLVKRESLLKGLSILNCKSIDGSFLKALDGLCPQLRTLTLTRCAGINRSAVALFQSRRPEVSVNFYSSRVPPSPFRASRFAENSISWIRRFI